MCLGAFSACPKIQMWEKIENMKNPGFWPSVAPPDLIWLTLGQETYCTVTHMLRKAYLYNLSRPAGPLGGG